MFAYSKAYVDPFPSSWRPLLYIIMVIPSTHVPNLVILHNTLNNLLNLILDSIHDRTAHSGIKAYLESLDKPQIERLKE